jgi:hypothetical protein
VNAGTADRVANGGITRCHSAASWRATLRFDIITTWLGPTRTLVKLDDRIVILSFGADQKRIEIAGRNLASEKDFGRAAPADSMLPELR